MRDRQVVDWDAIISVPAEPEPTVPLSTYTTFVPTVSPPDMSALGAIPKGTASHRVSPIILYQADPVPTVEIVL